MNRNRISDAMNQRLCCSGQLSGICLIYGHILLLQGFAEIWQAFLRDLRPQEEVGNGAPMQVAARNIGV